MAPLIECIPNFSEGRNRLIIDELKDAAMSVPGVMLLDYSADSNHNRSVFTLAGSPGGIEEAAFVLSKKACELIDLTKHSGEHPRMGAVDVIPFVPVRESTMKQCVEISRRVAKRIGEELAIPVFLYEESAVSEGRRNLAAIRKGEFEGMAEKLRLPEWAPDFGPASPHPTAGAAAVGARAPLIAFNVNLSTSDINIAKKIAKIVRGSSGGFKCCKAIGVMLESRNIAQVSMNMVDYEVTPLYRVFELIKIEAARFGVTVTGSELIGLSPAKALIDCAEYYLKIEGFDYKKQVLENHLFQ